MITKEIDGFRSDAQRIRAEAEKMLARSDEIEGRVAEMQAIPAAIAALQEQLEEVVTAIVVLADNLTALATIVGGAKKYTYREDGMPIGVEPDFGA